MINTIYCSKHFLLCWEFFQVVKCQSIFLYLVDNVTLQLDGVLYLRVIDPEKVSTICHMLTKQFTFVKKINFCNKYLYITINLRK